MKTFIDTTYLPYLYRNNDVNLNIAVDDDGNTELNIEILNEKYIDSVKMKLFTAPLHPTPNVLLNINIKDYVVSAKPDGIFTALCIDEIGNGYYLYPYTKCLYFCGIITNPLYFNVICNGELMERNAYGDRIQPYILLFDILEWNNNQITRDLSERVRICNEIVNNFKIHNTCIIKNISVKTYVPLKSIYRIISRIRHRKDGVIFTLKNGKPGKNCIRWKPHPTITVGLDYDIVLNDYYIYFIDTNHKGHYRKRYYNFNNRHYTNHKLFSSMLFRDLHISVQVFNSIYNSQHEYNCRFNESDNNILVELYIDIDAFYPDYRGTFEILKFRDDKKYPDNVNVVNDLLNLMYYPIRLDDIMNKKSVYNYWISPSKKAHDWMKYSKKVKRSIYERWATNGALLDLCAGRGNDAMLLYSMSKKKLFTEICCLEKDELQIEVLKDITTMIQHDNLFDMDCKINIKKGNMNDPKLASKYTKQFNTIICSNAIQFTMDPYEQNNGLNNIKKLLKNNGILILIFMNADKLKCQHNTFCHLKLDGYMCVNDKHEEYDNNDIVYDPGDKKQYTSCVCSRKRYLCLLCNVYSKYRCICDPCNFEPIDLYKNSTGLLYKYDITELRKNNTYYEKSHVWVKTPTTLNAIREPLVNANDLKYQLQHLGLELIESNNFNNIIKSENNLSHIYSYSIFRNTSYQLFIPSIMNVSDDILFSIFSYLEVVEIFDMGKTHRLFTDICLKYMKLQPFEWTRLYSELAINECESHWT